MSYPDAEPVPDETGEGSSLAEFLGANPQVGQDLFTIIDGCLQAILPGSAYHTRYNEIEEVGLAVAVTEPEKFSGSGLNPLGWWYEDQYYNISQEILFFAANNKSDSENPTTWGWKENDEAILGGEIHDEVRGIGRFAVVATAKINHLTDMPEAISSHAVIGPNVGEGKVSFAGGKAVGSEETGGVSLVAASGLWEVHDHIVSSVYSFAADRAQQYGIGAIIGRPTEMIFHDMVRSQLKSQFDAVQQILDEQDKAAEDLTPEEVNELIVLIEDSYFDTDPRTLAV